MAITLQLWTSVVECSLFRIIVFLISAPGKSLRSLATKATSSHEKLQPLSWPVTSSKSNKIGPEGGKIEFQSSDVYLIVPKGALPSTTIFSLEAYVNSSVLPPVTSEVEMTLSPVFHLSSLLPRNQHFEKPLQLFLPLEVPLRASDRDSGWLLQLKKSMSDKLPSEWHIVLQLNTKSGEVVSQSSFVDYDHASGTLLLDHFCRWIWKGFRLGFDSERYVYCSVFGRRTQPNKWEVAVHIMHKSKEVYRQLVRKLESKDYVVIKGFKPHTMCYKGHVSVDIQCLNSWKVQVGKVIHRIDSQVIWDCNQDESYYHEVYVEDKSCEADIHWSALLRFHSGPRKVRPMEIQ